MAGPVEELPLLVDESKFIRGDNCLLYEGHPRERPQSLAKLLIATDDNAAMKNGARRKNWWIAQAVFYGIPYTKTSTIQDIRTSLENRLRDNSLALPSHIESLEKQSTTESNKFTKEALEKTAMDSKSKQQETPRDSVTRKAKKEANPTKENTSFDAKPPVPPVRVKTEPMADMMTSVRSIKAGTRPEADPASASTLPSPIKKEESSPVLGRTFIKEEPTPGLEPLSPTKKANIPAAAPQKTE